MVEPRRPAIEEHVPLATRLTLGTGGNARYFVEVGSRVELKDALSWARGRGLPTLILGGGSNLVCADSGFDGLVIHMGLVGIDIELQSDGSVHVRAGAGETWDDFVQRCCNEGLCGIECLSGIPGQVGATPIQNVGAYGQEVKNTISKVVCLDRQTLRECAFDNLDCGFAYRTSRFKETDADRYVICEVEFRLRRGLPLDLGYQDLRERAGSRSPTVAQVRQAVLSARREKSMLLDQDDENGRSCGSFFLNPMISERDFAQLCQRLQVETPGIEIPRYPQSDGSVKLPAAWLIERAGFRKGHRAGHVGLSTKHALCIVAHDGATSREIREFARLVKTTVLQRLGVELHPEPRFVGFAPP